MHFFHNDLQIVFINFLWRKRRNLASIPSEDIAPGLAQADVLSTMSLASLLYLHVLA